MVAQSTTIKTINTNSYYISYISLSFMQCEVQLSCSQHSFLFIDQRLLAPTWKPSVNVRQVHIMTSCSSSQLSCTVISWYVLWEQVLKYVPIKHHCKLPHVRKKNLFHKLICKIQMFTRKIFMVQCHPQNILTSNYFQTTISEAISLLYMWYIWQTISLANWDVMYIGGHFSLVNRVSIHCS